MSQSRDAVALAERERGSLEHLSEEGEATTPPALSFPEGQAIHELFERRAAATPDAVALIFEGERLSYRELNARANRLAHRLRRLGAGPETCVGLLFERSLEMVVSVLGVLKAGGCYLPLDPAHPPERLSFMLEDARAPLLLTEEALLARVPKCRARVICFDRDRETIASESAENPPRAAAPENLAYVIYTSGSTGRPKGVAITHASVARLFAATRAWFDFSERDVWTLFHSYAFDFSVWEMWGALLYGGRVVVVPFALSRDPAALYELLRRERVTVLNQTPSAFRQLSRAEEALPEGNVGAQELALRLVVFGGEALELRSLRPWLERHGDERPRLVNMYGITETTVHVTYRPITIEDVDTGRGSVIGRAIPDLQVYVLDDDLRPVPAGLQGELYVGGAGLARGYLNRPGLTAAAFIPDPFSGEPGTRLYKTGDLARLMPGGDLEYLGRADDQVKVRGFRIELGEVNAALARHSSVRESVVLAVEGAAEEKRLVAYVVCDEASRPTGGELREFLREKLPEHMLPPAFVFLGALPLTPNGKVDRGALPAPDWAAPELEDDFVAPCTEVERALAAAWAEALGVRQVGIDDNYFELGGDSIRSIRVRAGALERGLDFSLQHLFQHPTIRELARHVSPVENRTGANVHGQPFGLISEEDRRRLPPTVEDAYPLSRLQSGMVFHSEYSPDYIVYVSSLHLRLPLDIEKLQSALDQMAARHEMLRTSFAPNGFSEPLQLVHQTTHLPLRVEDLRQLSLSEQQTRIAEWIKEETRRRFDWTKQPLLRFHVHLRGDDSIQFTMSEPFFDGWSVASFCTELFERYFALMNGRPTPTGPRLAASYRDFVSLEREALESERCRDFWAATLAGATASRLARRPFTRSADDVQEVARLEVPISAEVSDGLKRLAQSVEVSLKSVLLAAHMKVLGLLTGQADVLTGLLINGRPEKADGERVLGAFLNTVPLHLQLSGGTWADLARRASQSENELLPFRRYPIQELQRVHGAESLFDTVFNYTHFHVADRLRDVNGLEVLGVEGTEQTYYALTAQFNVDNLSSRVELALDCRTIELGEEQARGIAGLYSRVLAAMAAQPSARHEAASLLSDDERRRLLVELNDTRAPFPEDRCVHQLFEEQVERAPDAVAVRVGEDMLSYSELNRRANRLARHLRGLGVGPETVVGIFAERTLETLVGLLAVLKAGGAYLPLDPEHPSERIRFMLEDARARVILTQSRFLESLPGTAACAVCLDADLPAVSRESDENLPALATPDNLAYVVYTSGSTGQPKGVLVAHRGVMNMIAASIETFGVTSRSRVLQAASLSFDASVLEIFMALLGGATLYPVSRDVAASGTDLAAMLRECAITTMAVTPSLLDLIPDGEYPALHTVIVGGEACGAETAARWSRGRRLFNAYAPTEATVYATAARCAEAECRTPPLGRPIPNMRVYLLDSNLRPIPVGVPGEIHVGGVGLARGYLNRPGLTAERFIPDPFSRVPGARFYRTGDLARFLADGRIEFVGRTDSQVKVRGFRIELGEIETVLGRHPSVREATVVAREDAPGGKGLVAYVVAREETPTTTSEMRGYLKRSLPEYMLPAAFVVLDELPLTPTGKVDRAALPAPEQARPELAQVYVAPRTALEEVLCRIFSEVLQLERVGVRDSFFELGGHSLLATQVASRVRESLRVELPLRRLFEAPSVEGLAAILEREAERERIERTAELLLKLSALSDEEAAKLITEGEDAKLIAEPDGLRAKESE
ncbi:MAG TPA: amino acid adenylation domain-containing protein [Pyrinomonadaceae bacterium]|nr:amino acid adenylation domain-containing protein [Pyrinomonadaceae bacterium]